MKYILLIPLFIVCGCVNLRPGNLTPDTLEYKDLSGRTVTYDLSQGYFTILHFWSTWCAPCKHELLTLENLNRRLNKKKVQILSVAVDSPAGIVLEFKETFNLSFIMLIDAFDQAKEFYRISDIPQTLLINPEGKITKLVEPESGQLVIKTTGPQRWDALEVVSFFNNL